MSRFQAGDDIRAGEWVTIDGRTGTIVPMSYDGRPDPRKIDPVEAKTLLARFTDYLANRAVGGEVEELSSTYWPDAFLKDQVTGG